jgi:hypothetical protein
MEKVICAYANRQDTFSVGIIGPYNDITPHGNVRKFDTWEEADQVARDISKGLYPDIMDSCRYINMR